MNPGFDDTPTTVGNRFVQELVLNVEKLLSLGNVLFLAVNLMLSRKGNITRAAREVSLGRLADAGRGPVAAKIVWAVFQTPSTTTAEEKKMFHLAREMALIFLLTPHDNQLPLIKKIKEITNLHLKDCKFLVQTILTAGAPDPLPTVWFNSELVDRLKRSEEECNLWVEAAKQRYDETKELKGEVDELQQKNEQLKRRLTSALDRLDIYTSWRASLRHLILAAAGAPGGLMIQRQMLLGTERQINQEMGEKLDALNRS